MLRFPERTKTFSLGELIILTPFDLTELCQLVDEETNVICQSAITYAKSLGAPHKNKVDA